MHHVRIALDKELIGHFYGSDLSHPSHIVASQIQQHQMLGTFFRIAQQLFGEPVVFLRRFSAWPRTRNGTNRDNVIAQTHQNLGA